MENIDELSLGNTQLSNRLLHALGRQGILTVGDLKIAIEDNSLQNIRQIGSKTLLEIQLFMKEIINSQNITKPNQTISQQAYDLNELINSIKSIKKSNQISINELNLPSRINQALRKEGIYTLNDMVNFDSKYGLNRAPRIGVEAIQEICSSFKCFINAHQDYYLNEHPQVSNWARIIELFFNKIDGRKMYIFLSRLGYHIKTLEEIAFSLNITRERVRQIQGQVSRDFIMHLGGLDFQPVIKEILSILSNLNSDFSIDLFENRLNKKKLLGIINTQSKFSYVGEINTLETIFCWLTIISDRKYSNKWRQYYGEIGFVIDIATFKQAKQLSVKNISIIDSISSLKKREIFRRVASTGGIRLIDAKNILAINEEMAFILLENLNLVQVIEKWFSFRSMDLPKMRLPLRTAGLKMLTVINEMDFDVFYDGLMRYSNRSSETIAPPIVVSYLLRNIGFVINNQKISTSLSTSGVLSKSEICYRDAIQKNGNVASYLEIAEEFFAQGLSLPSVAAVTRRCPIVEKLENGLYKIRGIGVSWSEIDAAHKRQKKFSQDEEISYGLDGIVRVKITITSYAFLSGVINSYRIKDLSGKWLVMIEHESFGNAKMDDMYLWGLTWIFGKLKVQIGDRVELAFNTWNRKLSIRKV